jgi:hypothetical protein
MASNSDINGTRAYRGYTISCIIKTKAVAKAKTGNNKPNKAGRVKSSGEQ